MNNKIYLTMSKDYVHNWGVWEALREVLQNALDGDCYSVDVGRTDINITSLGGVLDRSTLLLGNSSKRDDPSTIGKYGEGYKLAMLVLLREGCGVKIYTGKELWVPSFKTHPEMGCECLCVTISNSGMDYDNKVVWEIDNLHSLDIMKFEDSFITKDNVDVLGEATDGIGFFFDSGNNPKIYVGGLFVADAPYNFRYSYNFSPEKIELDRDRNYISSWDASLHATTMIIESGKIEILESLYKNDNADVDGYVNLKEEAYSRSVEYGAKVVDAVVSGFIDKYGENAFPIDNSNGYKDVKRLSTLAVQKGLTPVIVNSNIYSVLSEKIDVNKVSVVKDFSAVNELKKYVNKYRKSIVGEARRELDKLLKTLEFYS